MRKYFKTAIAVAIACLVLLMLADVEDGGTPWEEFIPLAVLCLVFRAGRRNDAKRRIRTLAMKAYRRSPRPVEPEFEKFERMDKALKYLTKEEKAEYRRLRSYLQGGAE